MECKTIKFIIFGFTRLPVLVKAMKNSKLFKTHNFFIQNFFIQKFFSQNFFIQNFFMSDKLVFPSGKPVMSFSCNYS